MVLARRWCIAVVNAAVLIHPPIDTFLTPLDRLTLCGNIGPYSRSHS